MNEARFGVDSGRARCDHCGGSPSIGHREEMRCECGSLLARLVPGGVEIKCRRCKRTVVLPVGPDVATSEVESGKGA